MLLDLDVKGGYPGDYKKGIQIKGLKEVEALQDVIIFHAATKIQDGNLITDGGRVLGVTALGADIEDAIKRAYGAVSKIAFDGAHYRKDIGARALKHGVKGQVAGVN